VLLVLPYSGPVATGSRSTPPPPSRRRPVHCAFLNCCTQNPNPASSGSLDSSPVEVHHRIQLPPHAVSPKIEAVNCRTPPRT